MKSSKNEIFLKAYLIRKVEKKLLDLFTKGHIAGTIHTCLGQELTGVAIAEHIREDDWLISNHRCHGHYLARYSDFHSLIAEILGKPSGVCQGFGGSQHLYRKGFLSSGIQGGMTPTAVGMALSFKQAGTKNIVVNVIGDGTLGQGVVYEAFNFASLKKAPVLFVIENNHYAQSTSQHETFAGSIQKRAEAFGLPFYKSSTFDLKQLLEVSQDATNHVRTQGSAAVFEIETYRLGPHSKGDDFRDKLEITKYEKQDLLNCFLEENASNQDVQSELMKIDQKLDFTIEKILKEPNSLLITSRSVKKVQLESEVFTPVKTSSQVGTQIKEINAELHRQFDANPGLLFLGEDIRDPYGGAFKASQGLSSKHSDRVLNMPICEASIVGVSLGLALTGKTVVTEIMFGDFLAIAFDQILNHASKFRSMYSDSMNIPLVIRTPMGGGRGYGSTHSQSIEKYLAAIPDVDMYILHPRTDIAALYSKVLANAKRVAILIENKLLYQRSQHDELPTGYQMTTSHSAFPVTRLCTEDSADVTVISFGGIGLEVERAARTLIDEEINLDIYYPLHVSAFEVDAMIASIEKTLCLILVEEGTPGMNLSSQYLLEIFRRISNSARAGLKFRVITAVDRPIPAAKYLEEQTLPNWVKIKDQILVLYEH